jgi:ATP-dependent RNA helicase RhlB
MHWWLPTWPAAAFTLTASPTWSISTLPEDPEDYVHRIGRTGRAGQSGISIAFADEDDGTMLPQIEKYMGRELSCIHPEDEWLVLPPPPEGAPQLPDDPLTVKPYRGRPGGFRGGPPSGRPGRRTRRPRAGAKRFGTHCVVKQR